ncbi:MAG: glycosyltransferase [Verrucomicrobia bacterium]|nr:glycosyltransferase [Verrucomicrobiota bacterium]
MNLLILQDYLRNGGTERQSVLLANAFAAAGHQTTLLTFRPGGTLARTVGNAVHHRTLQARDFHLDWFAPALPSVARAVSPHVILCMGRMANCHGWRLTGLAPVIATMRTGKPLPWLFRQTLRRAARIVANSREAAATLIDRHRVDPALIRVIPNALVFPPEDAPTAPARDEWRARLGAGPATTVLLCVAMFRPEKNQRELIEIVAGLPTGADWQLWLAGDGPARAECERLVAARGLGNRVKFPGFLPNPAGLYHAADVAVHASWSEALSNFLIEAQAHGLPAVAYAAQGIAECFLPGETGWVIARDDRPAFRQALSALFTAPTASRNSLATTARRFARETFSPARSIAAYLELFQPYSPPAAP